MSNRTIAMHEGNQKREDDEVRLISAITLLATKKK
jgi:hypothetical protein